MSYQGYEPRTQKGLFGNVALWVIGLTVLVIGISAALWAGGVLFASTAGQGNAFKQKESANNRVFQQQNFVQLNEDFTAALAKIKIAQQAVKALASDATSEEKSVAEANMTGAQQHCVDVAQQYNADSQKYLARDFKSAGLPARLDPQECLS